jgi:Zn-finger nucleic acid-binding protein
MCSVLHECTCSIQSEGKGNEEIFILTLCFAVWITKGSLQPPIEKEAITALVASTMKPLVHSEVPQLSAKVKLPSIAYDALTW